MRCLSSESDSSAMHASHLLLSINSLSGLARPRAGLLRLYASIRAIVLANLVDLCVRRSRDEILINCRSESQGS